ncbi:thiol-disulfide oxidoreductase DCC family protein [Leptospira sp. 'Mane']|uniref:thiol-disulfide oxidoreductase DCC family protein n=1 Tax=Leptospira sp. 'Mane' TaxID=3387407 RepID=UPI00398AEAB6
MTEPRNILLFDGVCNLCNHVVQFVIKRDPEGKFKFAALQSEAGQALLKKFNLPKEDFDSFVLVQGETFHLRSTAGLHVLKELGGKWKFFYFLILFPSPLRDFAYSLVAKSRYRIFGRTDSCMIPTPELKSRFLN